MSEVNAMNCAEFGDVAAELALGVLTGRERADALAHLERCDACREHVRQLTTTGEELLGLLPSSEPPPGFETRVMDRLGLEAPAPALAPRPVHRRRERRRGRAGTTRPFGMISSGSRRLLAAAAVVVAVAAAALGGWGLHGATTTAASKPGLSTAALLSADHENVGEVFVYNGDPRWMYMSVDMDSGNRTVICQLISSDGRVTNVGSFQVTNGYGSWGSPTWVGDGNPVGARLITPGGTVLASATFPKAAVS
jgi:anti-sigma-K factor RskA